jgi:hypothetical protein
LDEDEDFVQMVKNQRMPYVSEAKESIAIQIEENFKNFKQVATKWAYEKGLRDEDLKEVEENLGVLYF